MIARKAALAALMLAALLASPASAPAAAGAGPAWNLQALAGPTHFKPGDESGFDRYEALLTNSGGAPSVQSSPITITDSLPKGLVVKGVQLRATDTPKVDAAPSACQTLPGESTSVVCTLESSLDPGEQLWMVVRVATPLSAAGPLRNVVEAQGGGAVPVFAESRNRASEDQVPAGLQEYQAEPTGPDGSSTRAADSHPFQYTTSFAFNLIPSPPGSELPFVPAQGDLKEVEVSLPPGMIANPTAVGRCSAQEFNTVRGETKAGGFNISQNECPDSSAVGVVNVEQIEGEWGPLPVALYNLVPPKGMPAQLAFQPSIGLPVYIDTAVRNGPEGLTAHAFVHNVTEAKRLTASLVTIWGTPGDPSHDALRGQCAQGDGTCPAGLTPLKPFLRLPSSCEDPLLTTMRFETWAQPAAGASQSVSEAPPSGCAEPDFSPTVESRPTTNLADSPAGLHFNLHLPQKEHEDPEGLGEADLRDIAVTLPRQLAVNPASADGLAACSPGQIGLTSAVGAEPIVFDEVPANCPPASKVATVAAQTPLLDHPIEGSVYLAQQENNPFKSLLAIYIALEDPQSGVVIKLASKVSPDPITGQLTTTVEDAPQAPVEDFEFDFFEGARASLRTPPSCGTYATTTQITPWTAPEGASSSPQGSFRITSGPDGSCPSGALAPKLAAGLANPAAGTYSPFSLRVSRADATGEFAGLTATPPLGLSAKLAGVPYCPQAAIDQAASRSHPGQGALEAAQPSCPAASQIGTVSAGAGAGPTPFYAAGKLYLAGPYKGAPLSFVAIIPALAGPFDLGVVANRIAAYVDPETAQVSSVADPLPRILSGIPLDTRDIRVNLDRPNFTLAPTSCEPKSVKAIVSSPGGASATASDRFQVGGCAALKFKPGFFLKLTGGTKRNDHPALKTVVTYPKGSYANIARAAVTLPPSEQIDQGHIQNPCTRVQFNANQCPAASILGYARAFSPLLDQPLEGPVYFRSNGGDRLLPDVVADLNGQIDVVAVGFVTAVHARIRTTFANVPDAPLSKFTLSLKSGKHGLLVNNRNICARAYRIDVKLTGQNGKESNSRPPLKTSCAKHKHRHKHHRKHR
jgi:hypothetical protein